jgi:phosphatidylglycerol:prolipoprotein diacylglycerol transferase
MVYTHNLSPSIFKLGPFELRWYGLMYITGFLLGFFLFKSRHKKGWFVLGHHAIQDLFAYLIVGMIIGARIFYTLIYNWDYYQHHIIEIPMVWKGGLSFHGALLGFTGAIIVYARKHKLDFWHLADHVCLGSAMGIFFGRIGNFINGELWGRPAEGVPWAMIFPMADAQPRHPSQLYQAFGEGLLVFIVLLIVDRFERSKSLKLEQKPKSILASWSRTGILASLFLILYGTNRFVIEFFRQPDAQLGYFFGWMSMGQILCTIMAGIGFALLAYRWKAKPDFQYEVPN